MDREIKEIIKQIRDATPSTEVDLIAGLGKVVEDINNKVYTNVQDEWIRLQNVLADSFLIIKEDWQIKLVSILSGLSEEIIQENKAGWKVVPIV